MKLKYYGKYVNKCKYRSEGWLFNMRKSLTLLIAVMTIITLVSCNASKPVQIDKIVDKSGSIIQLNTKTPVKYDPASWAMENAPEKFTPPNSSREMTLITQNVKLALYVDINTGMIGLLDKQYDKCYYSSPPDTENLEGIDFTFKEKVLSQIVVDTVDEIGNKVKLYSTTDSVVDSGLKLKKLKDSLIATYYFKAHGITIPVEFSLKEDYLQVKIDPKKIEEKTKVKVYAIAVMPYFGAIRVDEKGYLFVPDGSGAIIEANSTKTGTYYETILGYEDVLDRESIKNFQEKTLLPAFGIKNGDYGILGIIDNAYEKCDISAQNATRIVALNNAYTIWKTRSLIDVNLPAKNWISKTVSILEKYPDFETPFQARYYPLHKGKNEYVDMAQRYRNYLIEDKNVPLLESKDLYDGYLDLYGYVKKAKSIMGWPVVVDQQLTSLSQAKNIASAFINEDLKLGIRLNAWVKDGFLYKIPKQAKTSSSIGSKSELIDLAKYANDNNFTLFPSIDPITVYKDGNGFNPFNDAAKTVNNIAFTEYYYPVNLQYKNFEFPQARLLSPNKIISFTDTFIDSYNALNIGAIAFEGIGNRAYSDYGSNPCSRYQATRNIEETLKNAGKNNEVMVTAAAAYAIGYTKHSIAAPYESSNYIICDRSVPFYQIALRGIVNVSSPSINLDSEPGKIVLKCFETGSMPMFSFIGNETTVLNESALNYLYASDFSKWKEYANKSLTSFAEFNKLIKGRQIIAHAKLADGVFITTFDGKTSIVVNYNNKTAEINGQQIPAMGYKVIKGEGQ